MENLLSLPDDDLLVRFGDAVDRDNQHGADLLRFIAEIDRRRLWAALGHSSMFGFCSERFHMSEGVAYKRIGVARLARRFPSIFDMVGRGELHLSGVLRLKTLAGMVSFKASAVSALAVISMALKP